MNKHTGYRLGAAAATVLLMISSAACSASPPELHGFGRVAAPAEAVQEEPAAVRARDAAEPTALATAALRRFWVADKRFYFSDWYAGKHRKMINFGCTRAPYYDPSPLCTRNRGFHHGLDVAMPCGNRLYAGLTGRVVKPRSAGALGPAYGRNAFRLRNGARQQDFVFGHVGKVFVQPGDRVQRGDLVARASDQGAPDGCHLHFEVRPRAGSYDQAVSPHPVIKLRLRR